MTMTTRRVLLLSSDDEPLTDVESALSAAGYEIRRCVERGADAFPCAALRDGGACPLDDGFVDVALDVRSHPWPRPTPREDGVRCALRARVPVAVVGRSAFNPFEQWASWTDEGLAGVVEACDRAIDESLEVHRAAVAGAVVALALVHRVTVGPATVDVERVAGRLHATITASIPPELRTVVVTRAGVALRSVDPSALAIEIDLRDPSGVAV